MLHHHGRSTWQPVQVSRLLAPKSEAQPQRNLWIYVSKAI
jgi:hypothetical protein